MSRGPIKVLLIDTEQNAGLIKESLRNGGTAPFELEHGDRLATGLHRLAAGDIGVVLLELDLPDSRGLETFRRLRAEAPLVPIVLLSGPDDAPARQAVQEGAQDYLVRGEVHGHLLVRALRYAIEHKRAEVALRESERRYKQLLASITDYVYTVRVARGRPYATAHGPGCLPVTGYSSSEFAADPYLWYNIIHKDDRAAVLRQADRLLAGQEVLPLEHRIYHKDGSVRWIRNTPVVNRDEQGRVASYDGLIVDITERKRAEAALQASEAMYQSLVESIPLHVFRKDLAGRFTFANRRFGASLDRPAEQILGKTDLDFYPPDLAEKYRADDQKVIATGAVFEDTECYQKPGGERSYVTVVKTPVYGPGQAIIGIHGIFWDVTEQKWAEEQKSQMRVARAIQQKLFPTAAPALPGFDIGGATYPAEATGGDYFDYITLPGGAIGFVLGDVSGHGFGPALFAAVTHACLRTLALARQDIDLEAILATGNRLLYEDTGGDPFVTLFFARLDPQTRVLRYASAGHPAALVLDSAGQLRARLTDTGPALGIFPSISFPTAPPLTLADGEIVLLVSDGVLDAMSPDGEFFGVNRALEIIRSHRHRRAQEIVDALCHAARGFFRNTSPHDDITAVIIKVSRGPSGSG